MGTLFPEQHPPQLSSRLSYPLEGGVEVRIDVRLACLAAALTAASPPSPSEHPLVTSTRSYLASYANHPSVSWLAETIEQVWLLGLAMKTVQLGPPPVFQPHPLEQVPDFVQQIFTEPDAEELHHHLAAFWQDTKLSTLLDEQTALWQEVMEDIASVLKELDLVAFQQLFFGRFPFHLVIVPLANLVPSWVNGVGVSNTSETYAVCCLKSNAPYQSSPLRVLDLAQHEASHPVLEEVKKLYASVPEACTFVEESSPPSGRFAQIYEDHDSRWTETVIRCSTYFFLQEIGRHEDAKIHVQGQREQGVTAIDTYIAALEPWWQERRARRAPGLDGILDQLPSWLHTHVSHS